MTWLSLKEKTVKIKPIKNAWYNWLINYISETIRKVYVVLKMIISLFKANTLKQTVYGRDKKLNKSKAEKQSEENIINSIRNLFILKKEKKKIKIE